MFAVHQNYTYKEFSPISFWIGNEISLHLPMCRGISEDLANIMDIPGLYGIPDR